MFARFARGIVLSRMCRRYHVYSLNPCPTVEVMTNYNTVGVLINDYVNAGPSTFFSAYRVRQLSIVLLNPIYTEAKITR